MLDIYIYIYMNMNQYSTVVSDINITTWHMMIDMIYIKYVLWDDAVYLIGILSKYPSCVIVFL